MMAATKRAGQAVTLRVVQVTDIYKLDNFPMVKTMLDEKREEAEKAGGKCISVLTGDFLAPYLLSSLDKGRGMVTMLNSVPIDYVMFGNHEDDLAHKEVCKRVAEYEGVWLNTNMQDHEAMEHMQATEVLELSAPDAEDHKRKVGMLAVLSDSPSLYRQNCFGGATIKDPWETLKEYSKKLKEDEGCDMILPLCHLYEPQDEKTCEQFDFPVILSGHDHHVVNRDVEGTLLLKSGSDANNAVILDIKWETKEDSEPSINAEVVDVSKWAADKDLEKKVERAYSILKHLANSELCPIPDDCRPLSSSGSRGKHVTVAKFLWSALKKAINEDDQDEKKASVDCVLLNGGDIRGGKDYAEDEFFSLEDLKSEVQEEFQAVIVPIKGDLLSKGFAATQKSENPGFMQHDDGVEIDSDTHEILKIGGEPLDKEKEYRVALSRWDVLDGPSQPITEHFQANKDLVPEPDAEWPVYSTLIGYFAENLWKQVWDNLDKNHDGKLSKEEFGAADTDGDGKISKKELCKMMRDAGFEVDEEELGFVDCVMDVAGDSNHSGYLSPDELGLVEE